jgi:hypothetical protein
MTTIQIEVTAEDIARAKHNGWECPLAQALLRYGFTEPFVNYCGIYEDADDIQDLPEYEMTAKAAVFMERFDDGAMVKPTGFRFRRARFI